MYLFKRRGYKPLLFSNGILYASKGLTLYRSDDKGRRFEAIASIEDSAISGLLARFNLLSRILRLGFHYLVKVPGVEVYIGVIRKYIVIKRANSQVFVKLFEIPRGSRPLNICLGKNKEIIFGEYFSNPERGEVHIYCSKPPYDKWEIVYTFPLQSIRHIHSVAYDAHRDRYWVLTGDYEQEAGFWISQGDDISKLSAVIQGGQISRAVTLLTLEDRILTATDTQLEQNYVFELFVDEQERNLLQKTQGPCFDMIYTGSYFLATTVIEKSDFNMTGFVHLWASIDGKKWLEITKWEKDIFPKSLHLIFQFSRVELVRNEDHSDDVFIYGRGVKNINYKLIQLDSDFIKSKLLQELS